jgi:hypothetical protein
MDFGERNRALNSTRYNHTTSRATVVVTIGITKEFAEEPSHTGTFNLVDLAGAGKDLCLTDRLTNKNPINDCISVFEKMVQMKGEKAEGSSN